ncbi:MAG: DUF3465 domain-containing protein [Pyrinomonadaceae bacterium]
MNYSLTLGIILLLEVAVWSGCVGEPPASMPNGTVSVSRAFERHESNVQIEDIGVVSRTLADDTSGLPHQRIIVRLASGQTVLIEHNIDAAPRIDSLREGDSIAFSGEYIWNSQGGLVHWTHHDRAGRHPPGWLKYNGRVYE